MRIKILAFFMVLSFTGCFSSNYEDLSNETEMSKLVGSKFLLLKRLNIYGVSTSESGYSEVDSYYLVPPPGWGGPEIISESFVDKGNVIEIKNISKCTSCLSRRIKVMVSLLTADNYSGQPIVMTTVTSELIFLNGGNTLNFGEAYFKKIN